MTQENQLPLRGCRKGHAIPTAGNKGDNDDGITPLPSVAMSGGLSSRILDGKPSPLVGSSLNSTPWESRPTGYQFGRRRVISRVNSPTELVLPKHEAVREQGLSRKLTTRSRRCFVRVASWAMLVVASWAMLVVHFVMHSTTSTRPIDKPNSHIAESISHSDRGHSGGPFEGASSHSSLAGDDGGHFTLCDRKLFLKDMPKARHGAERPFGVYKWNRSLDNVILIENRTSGRFDYGRTGNQIRGFFHAFDVARDRGGALVMHEDGFPIETGLRSIFLGVDRTELQNRFGITFKGYGLSRMDIMMQKPETVLHDAETALPFHK